MKIWRLLKRVGYGLGVWIILFTNLFRRSFKAGCGHRTKAWAWGESYGERRLGYLKPEKGKRPEHCQPCLAKMAIRCAGCGRTIRVWDKICLYSPEREPPEYAMRAEGAFVFGLCCREFLGDEAGTWVVPGRVERKPNLPERLEAAVREGGCPVIMTKA